MPFACCGSRAAALPCALLLIPFILVCNTGKQDGAREQTPEPNARAETDSTAVTRDSAAAAGHAAPDARPVGFRWITSMKQFHAAIDSSPDELLVFELYADWCVPCRMVSPMLDKLAKQYPDRALFFKVDVDKYPMIAAAFKARGIPFVAFVKNGKTVDALMGIRPKGHYVSAIEGWGTVRAKNATPGDSADAG